MYNPPSYDPSLGTKPVQPLRPLQWPQTVHHIARLLPEASDHYLVGGVVRDALRGLPISDIDLVTAGDGLSVARRLANALQGAYYPVDKERGTGRALAEIDGQSITVDVATFRGPDLLSDLRGRDFTINAIAAPLWKLDSVVDPLDGQGDLLQRRVLRPCAQASLRSDPVRTLRAVRFSLRFDLHMTPETVKTVRAAGGWLRGAKGLHQPERVRDELFKLFAQTRPASALRLLDALRLLGQILPYPEPDADAVSFHYRHVERLSQLMEIISPNRTDNTASDVILGMAVMVLDRWRGQLQEHLDRTVAGDRPYPVLAVLAALTPPPFDDPGPVWADHLHLSNQEALTITQMIRSEANVPKTTPVDARAIHRYYRTFGEAGVTGVLLWLARFLAASPIGPVDPVAWGHRLDATAAPLLDAFFRHHQQIVSPPPLITGADLMRELALTPGATIGKMLDEVLEAQAAGEIRSREEAIELAREIYAGLA